MASDSLPNSTRPDPSDSISISSDSSEVIQTESTIDNPATTGDHSGQTDSLRNVTQNETRIDEIRFSSSDSLIFTTRGERRITLHGNARVHHEEGELTAGEVLLNLDKNLMSARAAEPDDTLSQPILKRGEDQIRSQRIQYNYRTDKGKFDVARLNMDQGNVIGTQVKRIDSHVVFVEDGIYSTCDLDHPHFYIRAHKMKVVDEDKIFFTQARLFILDIPYPFVFPFGYVPSRMTRRQSGIIEPSFTYQDQQRRGIGIQNLGWFQYFNDYLTGQMSLDIFTSGTFYLDSRMNYRRTNRYNGSFEFGYSRDQGLEPTDPDFSANIQRRIGINHSQTINPYSSVSAHINLRTQDYYNRNSYDINDRAETSTSSRVAYNFNHPAGSYSFNISGRHSRNFATDLTSLTGPDVSFSLRRITPFQGTGTRAGQSWYESINIQYRNNLQSRYNFRPEDTEIDFWEALLSPSRHRAATGDFRHINIGLRHTVSANAQLLSTPFANLSTNINMNEYWYPQTLRKEWDADQSRVVSRMETGFDTGRDFQTSLSANTTLYGITEARIGRFEGFRHTLRPSISFSYRPDFSVPYWGVYRDVQSSLDGDTQIYSKFEGGIIGGPGAGRQQTLGLSINNILETKEVHRDTTGERSERTIRLIDRLNVNVNYNFAAERFNLSDLTTSISSSFFQNIRLNANAAFSFYDTDENDIRIDRYLWEESNRLMRLINFRFSASTQFSGGGNSHSRTTQASWHYPKHYDPFDQSYFHPIDQAIYDGQVQRIDVPWSFNLNFNYSWQLVSGGEIRRRAIVNAQNIQIRLTPEWQMGTQLGYDFVDRELTPSRFNITRNLHCWDLTFQWNPFGDFKFFLFRLTVRDSQLQGLFQKLPGLNNLEKSSSPINRFQ
ncbi:MAG: putative LPS assembly protein LptD [Balneolales bacterium]